MRKRWEGIRGHGQAQGGVGKHMGPWAGPGSGGKAYGVMGRHRERWEGIRGHGQAQEAVHRGNGQAQGAGGGRGL